MSPSIWDRHGAHECCACSLRRKTINLAVCAYLLMQAFWMRPAAMVLLHAFGSLLMKMLLMHAYAALFMLLAQVIRPMH